MNELLNLEFNGSQVRTIIKSGEPWFCLHDICLILAMRSNKGHDFVKRLNDDQHDLIVLVDKLGRHKKFIIVNESALYKIILRSDKPEAKLFQDWVTYDVLPSIRKTGKYQLISNPTSNVTDLAAELTRINELFRVWQSCSNSDYGKHIIHAIAEMSFDFARNANAI